MEYIVIFYYRKHIWIEQISEIAVAVVCMFVNMICNVHGFIITNVASAFDVFYN